jgi:hypothetical protein
MEKGFKSSNFSPVRTEYDSRKKSTQKKETIKLADAPSVLFKRNPLRPSYASAYSVQRIKESTLSKT